jgi:APA family basic amino acid/polyamine antiporter
VATSFTLTRRNSSPEMTVDPSQIHYVTLEPGDGPTLARKLGLFDITMLVMGSVIGVGIFVVPHDVAELVHTPALILVAWVLGGLVSLAGSLVYADLSRRRPHVGGQYAFLREAYHPAVAFLYGWSLLWVIQSGGMASVAVVFARYFLELVNLFAVNLLGSTGQSAVAAGNTTAGAVIAAVTIAALTAINCVGVRTGSTTQNLFMVLKILSIATLIVCGLLVTRTPDVRPVSQLPDPPGGWRIAPALAAALVPVLFAYGGWHTTTFMAAEVCDARRNLPRGLLLGVTGVTALYLGVNIVCVRVLGAEDLATDVSPASDVMSLALGAPGAAILSAGIAISAIGFLSQAVLTSPRVYYAMARDGLFFQGVAWVHPRTRVPTVAILLQGAFAIVIAVSGTFHEIVNYVMSVELVFLALTALSLFILRSKDAAAGTTPRDAMPGHPVTTLLFTGATVGVVVAMFYEYPRNSAIGLGIAAAGLPAYEFWRWRNRGQKNIGDVHVKC